ncbi:MAG: glutamate 5-kinase [Clostridiales bacterium]|nr:glutamate 5-kinase [Clostridiales bacterium]
MGREALTQKRRVVIKVGTSTLTHPNGRVNLHRIDQLARVLSDISNTGRDVVLVSSGAIGVGVGKLKIGARPQNTAERQAIAAVGQCELMQLYSKTFSEYGHIVGQILLTRDVVDHEYPRKNVINTFETLLKMGIIPIVNENDSVSTEELESRPQSNAFGDNDTLSAVVATLIRADLLILLTDTDGFYSENPRENPKAELVRHISEITPEIERAAGGVGSARGTGGMVTKLEAARLALSAGIDMVLANGAAPSVIYDIFDGAEAGTWFSASSAAGPEPAKV